MKVSDQQLRQSVVALLTQLVTVGTPFRAAELEDALANVGNPGYAPSSAVSVAVRAFFVNQDNGSLSVAAMLNRVVSTATATHVLNRSGEGFIVSTV